jgi:hypothetical protein
MENLILFIERLSRIATPPLIASLVLLGAVIVVVRNWRITLPVMIVQYVLVGILLARSIQPGLALIVIIAGIIVCAALSIAAQRVDDFHASRGESIAIERVQRVTLRTLPTQVFVRIAAAMLVVTVAFAASTRYPLPGAAREFAVVAYALGACSLVAIGMSSEVLSSGIALLLFISAVELAYLPLEQNIDISILLGFLTLSVGIVVAYLALMEIDATPPKETREIVPIESEPMPDSLTP